MAINGNGAIAIGKNTFALAQGIAIGNEAKTGWGHVSERAIAIGPEAFAGGSHGVAIGSAAVAYPSQTMAIGRATVPMGAGPLSIAIGFDTHVLSGEYYSVALGIETTIEQGYSNGRVAIGVGSKISGDGAVAIGVDARASGMKSVAVGASAIASGEHSMSVGMGTASGKKATAVGSSFAVAEDSTGIGNSNSVDEIGATAVGSQNYVTGIGSIALGVGLTIDRQEVAVVGVRDLEVARSANLSPRMLPEGGVYGVNPETGVILSDSAGVKWRVSVGTDGTIAATAYEPTPPIPFEWDLIDTITTFAGLVFTDVSIIAASNTDTLRWTEADGWVQINVAIESVNAVSASPDGTIIIDAPAVSNLRRSNDSGATWTDLGPTGSWSWQAWRTLSMDDTGTLISVTYEGSTAGALLVSTDGGSTFADRSIVEESNELSMPNATVTGDGATIYGISALTNPDTGTASYSLWKSMDAGLTWEQSEIDFDGEEGPPTVQASYDGSVVLVSGLATAWRSNDAGATFSTLASGPFNSIDSATGEVWAASSPLRVSTNGGDTFETIVPPPTDYLSALGVSPNGSVYAVFNGEIWRKP